MQAYLITGTSRGIGAALAALLLQQGARVIGVARSENRELLEISSESPGSYVHIPGDLQNSENVPTLAERALGYIDFAAATAVTLVNNAGVLEPIKRLEELEPREVRGHFDVNVTAPLLLLGAFFRLTEDLTIPRRVVNITSGAGSRAYPGWGAYCAGKASLDMVTRVAAEEQNRRGTGVRVIGIAPGVVDTQMQETIRASDEVSFPLKEKFLRLKAEGGLYTPENSASLILKAIEDETIGSGEIVDVRKRYTESDG